MSSRMSFMYPAGLARTTSADTTTMVASLWGSMETSSREPSEAGFCPPSATQPAVGLPVTTVISVPPIPRGIWRASCWTAERRRVSSKIGPACSAVRNPEKSLVRVAAVIAIDCSSYVGRSWPRFLPGPDLALQVRQHLVVVQRRRSLRPRLEPGAGSAGQTAVIVVVLFGLRRCQHLHQLRSVGLQLLFGFSDQALSLLVGEAVAACHPLPHQGTLEGLDLGLGRSKPIGQLLQFGLVCLFQLGQLLGGVGVGLGLGLMLAGIGLPALDLGSQLGSVCLGRSRGLVLFGALGCRFGSLRRLSIRHIPSSVSAGRRLRVGASS